jgi:hypothetical protein
VGQPVAEAGMMYALNHGKQWAESGLARMANIAALRYYFQVSTAYVANKTRLVLAPYLFHRGAWNRRLLQSSAGDVFLPPRDDINAPDLYIPTMAFVTYVLLCALAAGLAGTFKPEALGLAATKGLALLALSVLVVKAGFYLVSTASPAVLDVVALCGYVFVGVVVNTLVGIVLGQHAFYIAMFVTALGMATFLVRTFRLILLAEPAAITQDYGFSVSPASSSSSVQNRNSGRYFLVIVGALQFVLSYFLSRY